MLMNFNTARKPVLPLLVLLVLFTFVSMANIVTMAEKPASGNQITLKVLNITFKELVLFEAALQKRIPSIKNLDSQNFDAARKSAEINVTTTDNLHQFSKTLVLSEFEVFEVEVLNLGAQTLEIRLNQKPNAPAAPVNEITHKPKIMILIAERPLGNQVSKDAAETEMIRKFTEKGFKVISPAALKRNRNLDQIRSIMSGNTNLAASIGQQYGAELLIIGEASSERGKMTYGLRTCRATVNARVIEVDTIRILVANSKNAAGADATENIASKKSLQNAGGLLADYLIDQITKEWNASAASTYDIQLVISKLTFSQLVQLDQTLKKLNDVETVHLQSFNSGVAVIELRSQHSAQKLGEALVSKSFNHFSLDVTNFTTNRIDIKADRAPSDYDVQLVVSKLTFSQLVQLEQLLKKVSGVDTVYLRSFDSQIAVIEVLYQHGAQKLAGELSGKSLTQFSLDVTNFTADRIDVIAKKKSAVYNTQLVVSKLTFSQLAHLEQTLKKLSGVETVNFQSFDSGVAVIQLNSQHKVEKLAEILVSKSFNQFSLDVTHFNANGIEIEVQRAPAVYAIELVISELTFSQLVQVEQGLKKMSSVSNVYLQSFDSDVAVIQLHTQHGAQRLAGELVNKPFTLFTLDIRDFTVNRIDIEVIKKK